jgi:hypothetical protein
VGVRVGDVEGEVVGCFVDAIVGIAVGILVGAFVGATDCTVGFPVTKMVGASVWGMGVKTHTALATVQVSVVQISLSLHSRSV